MQDAAAEKARDAALRLLARRGWSRAELTERLATRGHQPELVADVLDRLAAVGLLDDRAYARELIDRVLRDLRPGVTEVYVHPAIDTAELRALAPDWHGRVDDHDLVVHDGQLRAMLARGNVKLIGYRALRQLQRAG